MGTFLVILAVMCLWFVFGFTGGCLFCRMCRARDDIDLHRKQGQKAALDAIDDLRTRNQARREDESR